MGELINVLRNPVSACRRVIFFYVQGFREMTVGRSLWALIIVKLVILFAVFKIFFFPDHLKSDYDTDVKRAEAVRSELMNRGR